MRKEFKLSRIQEMLFALLRTALNEGFKEEDSKYFEGCTDRDWISCLGMADESGVIALACHGMTLLPSDEMRPNTNIRVDCIRALYQAKGMHRIHCKAIERMERLFHSDNIDMMVMKGVGISAYYPTPYYRKCGDVDIFTYSLDTTKISDDEANAKSDKVVEDFGLIVDKSNYKHSCFTYYDVDFENHKYFVNVKSMKEAVDIDNLLRKVMAPERVTFDNEHSMNIPSPTFNALFIAFHASQHLGDILNIYHLCDWACILKKYGMIIPQEVKSEGFLKFVACMTSLSNKLLGTDIPVEYDPKLETIILKDMLSAAHRNRKVPRNRIEWLIERTESNLYSLHIKKNFYDVSLWRALKHTIAFHWKKAMEKRA